VAAAFNEMTARLGRVLEAQREFVANASHQLRTPLTGLRLRLEAAGLKATDPELERELAAAEHETERLSKLLTALLTLAQEGADAGPARPVDLRAAAEAARERWLLEAARAGRDILLAGDGEAWARASEEDVAIALDNLLENALLYSPPATAVSVEWSSRDGVAALAVADRGHGVAAEDAELLFERFARGPAGRAVAPGTGLGLAIVRSLARRWDGEATIGGGHGGGTRAELRLPAAAAPARTGHEEVPVA
jgi:two-component system OmpR family sensor kinase